MSILNVTEKFLVDNSIVNSEIHTHQPYTMRFNNNDEIRIPIQEDMCTLPGMSHIYIEGQVLKEDNKPSPTARFINNGVAHLFSEIRYELNGVVVDSLSRTGVASTMKAYASFTPHESVRFQNAGWFPEDGNKIIDATTGNFNVCIPLRMLLGFAEDYKKVILNIRQELVLIRSNTDKDAIHNTVATENLKVVINKIYWKVPHITPALAEELALTKYIDKNVDTQVAFRSWELHTYPAVPITTKNTWAVKTTTKLESPRYIIFGFQTNREGQYHTDMSKFDSCDFSNIRIYLNTGRYPYDNLNINFKNNQFATLYEMYARFQSSYYGKEVAPLLSPSGYKQNAPLIIIDCSNQKETLQTKAVELRIEFETNTNIPEGTTAYCLILHDRLFTYNALTKSVRQM